jgi:hypothetical protein
MGYQGAKVMVNQGRNSGRVPGRTSSTGAAVSDRPEIAASITPAGDRLHVEGDNRQLRVLAQIGARKVEELITQTYVGDHEKMKLAVDNVAVALQGLQIEMARLTDAALEAQLAERGKPGRFHSAHKLKDRLLLVLDTERTADLAVEMTA